MVAIDWEKLWLLRLNGCERSQRVAIICGPLRLCSHLLAIRCEEDSGGERGDGCESCLSSNETFGCDG